MHQSPHLFPGVGFLCQEKSTAIIFRFYIDNFGGCMYNVCGKSRFSGVCIIEGGHRL